MTKHTVTTPSRESATNEELAVQCLGPRLHEELPPPFSIDEYHDRWRRVKEAMEAARLTVLYVSKPADICYLTGYQLAWYGDAWYGASPRDSIVACGLAIGVEHDTPIFFDCAEERLIGTAMSCTTDYRVFEDADDWQPGAATDLASIVADTLKAEGWLKGTVGLQRSSYRPAPAYSELFRAALEVRGARVVDASRLVAKVSQRKSDQELGYVREAARIGDIGMRGAVDAITVGATELEVWAAATAAMARHGGELSALPGMVNSGPKCASLHGLASRRKLKPGDLVNIDMCGVSNRYHANLARTIALGEPTEELRDAVAKTRAVFRAVAAGVKPGMSYRAVLELNEEVASELRIWADRWWVGGYELGIAFTPDWMGLEELTDAVGLEERTPDWVGLEEQTLEPGMVMNHEFNFYLPNGWGIPELIDTMIVTNDRVESVHKFPIDLTVVE